MFGYYTALLAAMGWCFLGIGMLISALARSTDVAQGAGLHGLADAAAVPRPDPARRHDPGQVAPEVAVGIALANPLQVFRTAALALFDPQLIVLGPSAFVILDTFGATGYKFFALLYPTAARRAGAGAGYLVFRRGDLP
jgi:ABC-2 type transport system permease protein